MDDHTLERLEFGKVLERIATECQTPLGAAAARALRPSPDLGAIRTRSARVAESAALMEKGRHFPVERFEDPAGLLERAAIEDAALTPGELQTVAIILRNAETFQAALRRDHEAAPSLWKLAFDLVPNPELREAIETVFEPDGSVSDSASAELKRIRRELRRLDADIRRRLDAMVQRTELQPYLTGDYVTHRSGRNVIPVASVQAGQVPGIIHDRSDSGATVFIEPQAVVPLGNDLRSLAAEEEQEVQRILRGLTAKVRQRRHGLERNTEVLTRFDLLRAAAVYARQHHMRPVAVAEGGPLVLVAARHPVLERSLEAAGEEVVPLDFRLGDGVRTVAITGANAGGKTVALKTIGLVTLMAHAGLLVPAAEGSRVPLLARVLVDIGDEQSIEANLSTFSGHIRHIRGILGEADARTLVLLDELGAGTDPVEGSALACAVVAALHRRGALTVVTTHLGQVKGFVHEQDGMENAAVEFDPETLQPAYRLHLGRPGASHALAIARRFGLPDDVLSAASALVDSDAIAMEGLLERLTAAQRKAEADAATARRQRREAEAARTTLQEQLDDLKRERKEALRQAAREAKGLVENTRRELEQAIRRAREAGADAEEARAIRRRVEQRRETLKEKTKELAPRPRAPLDPDALEPGMRVWVESMQRHGTIVRVERGKATVEAGGLPIETDVKGLMEPDPAVGPAPEPRQGRTVVRGPAHAVGVELDLRGQRADEARRNLETYLHEATLAGLGQVRIIHGFGTGALQRMVHEFLADLPLVTEFRFGRKGEGGHGVTVATLRE